LKYVNIVAQIFEILSKFLTHQNSWGFFSLPAPKPLAFRI